MKDLLLNRRIVLGAAATGLLGACATSDEDPNGPNDPSDRGGVPDGGSGDGENGSGEGGTEMDTPIDALIAKAPYDQMTVTAVDDGALTSWDITYLASGAPILRYRLQGVWDGESGQADGYQRLEEVRALEGAPSLQGQIVIPRSNWEFAFQIDVDGDKQFVPYHGTPTAYAAVPSTPAIDGSPVDTGTLAVDEPLAAQSFSLEQTVHARHPARGETDLVEITTNTTWTEDGRLTVTGVWNVLEDVTMGSAYGPMLPFSRDIFDEVGTDTSEYIEVQPVPEATPGGDSAGETIDIDGSSAAVIRSSDTGWTAAIRWLQADRSLRADANAGGDSDVFLQLREDGIAKIYPQVWDPGELVAAGTAWEFGAEWMIVPKT